jgi:ankyrin repeat protein
MQEYDDEHTDGDHSVIGELFIDALFRCAENGFAAECAPLAGLCRATMRERTFWSALSSVANNPNKRTRLMSAAVHDRADRVAWLAKCSGGGKSLEQRDALGRTALLHAAGAGATAAVRALIAAGARVDAIDAGNATALHAAALIGHAEIASLLIGAGAKVDARMVCGATPLCCAAAIGSEEALKVLLAAGARWPRAAYDVGSKWALAEAEADGGTSESEAPHPGGGPATKGGAGLFSPASIASALRAQRLRFPRGETALHAAARGAHVACVSALLAAGAEADSRCGDGATPLLCVAKARPRGDAATAPVAADRLAVMCMLLEAGADVDAASKTGLTALHASCMNADTAFVKALLRAGADLEARDIDGITPLWLVSETGMKSILGDMRIMGAGW